MGCGGSKENMSESAKQFVTVLNQRPDFLKFAYKSDNSKTMVKAIASPVFGGTVFQPVAKKGHKREKKNPLYAEITGMNTEVIYNGGYYFLPRIREEQGSQQYYDVYLLTHSIKDQDMARKIKLIHDMNLQSNELTKATKSMAAKGKLGTKIQGAKEVKDTIKTSYDQKPVFWKDIQEGLTGFCRIIKYTNHSVPNVIDVSKTESTGSKMINFEAKNLEINQVEEGRFENGLKQGYCRVMYAKDGSCEVGFFNKNAPMGKYCMYKADGTYILPEGLYEGIGKCKSKIEIAHYMQQTSTQKSMSKAKAEKWKAASGGFNAEKIEEAKTKADDFEMME